MVELRIATLYVNYFVQSLNIFTNELATEPSTLRWHVTATNFPSSFLLPDHSYFPTSLQLTELTPVTGKLNHPSTQF